MEKNCFRKGLVVTFLSAIIILVPFTSVTGSSVFTTNNIETNDGNEVITVEHNSIASNMNKINLKNSFIMLRVFLNFIQLRFNGYPELVSLCQQVITRLNILGRDWPGLICDILISISEILSEITYYIMELGFLLISILIDGINRFFWETIFWPHCKWTYPHLDGSKSIYNFITFSEEIKSSEIHPCPCMQQ